MRQLTDETFGDSPLIAGQFGGVGSAGFLAVAARSGAHRTLRIDRYWLTQFFGTEGAIDLAT